MWLPCGHQDIRSYVTSVVIRSRKITNLWMPVTSLIMVWFSIRKKVLESSWSPLSDKPIILSFPLFEMTVLFPFQSNLTPMSCDHHKLTNQEPWFIETSQVSSASRRHLRDFVRLHPKLHSHLKSKAVRTALLKISWSPTPLPKNSEKFVLLTPINMFLFSHWIPSDHA